MYNGKKLKTIETVANTELKQVSKLLSSDKLYLDTGKSELLFFQSRRHLLSYNNISIKFCGKKLFSVDQIKYLGSSRHKFIILGEFPTLATWIQARVRNTNTTARTQHEYKRAYSTWTQTVTKGRVTGIIYLSSLASFQL